MTTLVDTNVLIYLSDSGSEFHLRAIEAFDKCRISGPIVLTDMAYAEFSIGMEDKISADAVIVALDLDRRAMSDQALFEAGRIFLDYQKRGGERKKPLPDHFIAAHAIVINASILTLNVRDFDHCHNLNVIGI